MVVVEILRRCGVCRKAELLGTRIHDRGRSGRPALSQRASRRRGRLGSAGGARALPGRPSPWRRPRPWGRSRQASRSRTCGRRARQTRRPCWIRRWLRSTHSDGGTTCISSRSICSGVLPVVRPRRLASRLTCVSTTMPSAIPKAVPSTTLAVLRPTPLRRRQGLQVPGDLAAVAARRPAGHRQQVAGLGPEKTGRADQRLELGRHGPREACTRRDTGGRAPASPC